MNRTVARVRLRDCTVQRSLNTTAGTRRVGNGFLAAVRFVMESFAFGFLRDRIAGLCACLYGGAVGTYVYLKRILFHELH